jgi:hypothetical protein
MNLQKRLFQCGLLVAALLISTLSPAIKQEDDHLTTRTPLHHRFGVDINEFENLNNVPFSENIGTLRLWDLADYGVSWGAIQFGGQNSFKWTVLDQYAQYALAHDVDVIYPVSATPHWASSYQGSSNDCKYDFGHLPGACYAPADWSYFTTFLTALVSRYNSSATPAHPQTGCASSNPKCNGVIKYYEIWNEPSVPTEWNPNQNYNQMNSMQLFVTLNQLAITTIRGLDPKAKLLFGAVYQVQFMTDFWATYNGPKNFDYVAYHSYPMSPDRYYGAPENTQGLVSQLKAVMAQNGVNLPIMNTEGSYLFTLQPLTDAQISYYAVRYALLHFVMNADKFVWYQWDKTTGLFDPTTQALTYAGDGYVAAESWLAGSRLEPAKSGCLDSSGTLYNILDPNCAMFDFRRRKADWGRTFVVNMRQAAGSAAQAVWYVYTAYNPDCNTTSSDCFVDWSQTTPYQVPAQYNASTDTSGNTVCVSNGQITATAEPVLLTNSSSCE